MPEDEQLESNAHRAAREEAGTFDTPVNHCPFCGESIGSFWGKRGEDGSHWCESCQVFFRVVVD
jgi:hypothetical protein